MRTIIGMILGCLLTIAAAYIHDTAAPTTTGGAPQKIVNWDVAAREWGLVKAAAYTAWKKLQAVNIGPSKNGAG